MKDEKEWFASFPDLTILPVLSWALIICALLGALWAGRVFAEPIVQASVGDVTVVVFNEKCTHPDFVTNLPNRATWTEKGRVFDGCAGIIPDLGLAMFWFTDKTVAVVPLEMFQKVKHGTEI